MTFSLMWVLNVVTAGMGVYFNVGKILYTVVYLPLVVIAVGKAVSIIMIMLILLVLCNKQQRNTNI
jgi:hypothetical protein